MVIGRKGFMWGMVGQGTDDCKVPEPIDGAWHVIIPRQNCWDPTS